MPMAKFQRTAATTALLLALSASLCLADHSTGASEPWAEGPYIDDFGFVRFGPESDMAFSPETEAILEDKLRNLTRCIERLSQGGDAECVSTVNNVVERNEGPTPNVQCCKNVVDVDGAESRCWDLIFPDKELGRGLVTELVSTCKERIQAPVAAPWPSP